LGVLLGSHCGLPARRENSPPDCFLIPLALAAMRGFIVFGRTPRQPLRAARSQGKQSTGLFSYPACPRSDARLYRFWAYSWAATAGCPLAGKTVHRTVFLSRLPSQRCEALSFLGVLLGSHCGLPARRENSPPDCFRVPLALAAMRGFIVFAVLRRWTRKVTVRLIQRDKALADRSAGLSGSRIEYLLGVGSEKMLKHQGLAAIRPKQGSVIGYGLVALNDLDELLFRFRHA